MLLDRYVLYLGFWPIFLMVILAMFLRGLLTPSAKATEKEPTVIQDWNMKYHLTDTYVENVKKLNKMMNILTPKGQYTRKEYLTNNSRSPLNDLPPAKSFSEAMSGMQSGGGSPIAGMMGSQIGFVVQNGGLGYAVSYFFSGFIVAKVPFTLTHQFRSMLQRGVEIPNLDVSYVSAMSWYFILLLGSSSIVQLIQVIMDPQSEAEAVSAMSNMIPFGAGADSSDLSAKAPQPAGPMGLVGAMQDKSDAINKEVEALKNKEIQWACGSASKALSDNFMELYGS